MAFQFISCIFPLFCFHSQIAQPHTHEPSNKISTSFLNQLSGVQKGDNVKGIHQLKNYLSYLGCLNHDQDRKHKDDVFDESLEIALKRYQEFYALNITGLLDANTIMKMRQPRCGMPDFFNPNKSDDIPFRAISRYSLFTNHQKWDKYSLTYAFDSSVREDYKQPLVNAMTEWTYATPFRFKHASHDYADIKISFVEEDHGDGVPFRHGELAHTFAPPDGRVHFAKHRSWSYWGTVNIYTLDLQTVALHELGHALGLGHSEYYWAVMYPVVIPGEIKHLQRDDIDGIRALYHLEGIS